MGSYLGASESTLGSNSASPDSVGQSWAQKCAFPHTDPHCHRGAASCLHNATSVPRQDRGAASKGASQDSSHAGVRGSVANFLSDTASHIISSADTWLEDNHLAEGCAFTSHTWDSAAPCAAWSNTTPARDGHVPGTKPRAHIEAL